jgi:hypothetical protein
MSGTYQLAANLKRVSLSILIQVSDFGQSLRLTAFWDIFCLVPTVECSKQSTADPGV